MNLNVNIIFIILAYQCFTIHTEKFVKYKLDFDLEVYGRRKTNLYDCYMPMDIVDYKMPIPFTIEEKDTVPSVIRPNKRRYLHRKHMDYFSMACVGSRFIAPVYVAEKNISELTVQCLNGTYVQIDGQEFEFDFFRCEKMPVPILKLTQERCQNIHHRVAEIGFQTKHHFLKLYSTCFEMEKKNVLYSWYIIQCPLYEYRQITKKLSMFKTPQLFEDVDPQGAYENQSVLLGNIVNSTDMKKHHLYRIKGTRSFTTGLLTPKNAFIFSFEQQATYYYENTAPLWYIFKEDVWKNLEKIIKSKLSDSNHKHVIVTGTYGTLRLPDEERVEQSLYLSLNQTMKIPEYIWKMNYDLTIKVGMVYIGMNNPYSQVNKSNYICRATRCPGGILKKRALDKQLIYCCTKDAFELTYGKIDLTVYREIEFVF